MRYIPVTDFYDAAPRAMAQALGPLSLAAGAPRRFRVMLRDSRASTAGVIWRDLSAEWVEVWLCLPVLPCDGRLTRHEADTWGGYLWHEISHCVFTDRTEWERACQLGPMVQNLTNGLEDGRIEQALIDSGVLPGAGRTLDALLVSMLDRRPGAVIDWNAPHVWPWTLAVFSRHVLRGFAHSSLPPVSSLALPLRNALDALRGAASTGEVVDIALSLAALAPKAAQAQAQAQALGNGQGQGQGEGEGQGQDASEGRGESLPGTAGDAPDNRGGAGSGGTGAGDNPAADPEPLNPDPRAMMAEVADAITERMGEPDDGDHSIFHEIAGGRNREEIYGPAQDAPSVTPEAARRYGRVIAAQDARLAKARTANLRAAVRLLVKSPARVDRRRFQTHGRLDRRALSGMAADRSDVFTRRAYTEGHETCVGILVDHSGSMDTVWYVDGKPRQLSEMAGDLGRMICEAVTDAGAPVMLSLFSDGYRPVITPKAKPRTKHGRAGMAGACQNARGSTALVPAMLKLAKAMRANYPQATRYMLLTVTDGQADGGEPGVAACSRLLASWGIEPVGIGLGYDVRGQYPRAITLNPAQGIEADSLKALADGLRALKP